MTDIDLAPYTVSAFNLSHASENKIHDDAVAARLGFAGGLVPGVEVYAYATHFPVAVWGPDWLECGAIACRLTKPVYDGRLATVTASRTPDGLTFQVRSEGADCAAGSASPPSPGVETPDLADFPAVAARTERPPANEETLRPGLWLGTEPLAATEDYATAYLRDAREANPIYAERKLVHPGIVLRMCNWALSQNVRMGAWIHVASATQNLSAARVGDVLTARAKILANYDRKGHKFADLDVLVVANDRTAVARVKHSVIYLPRQLSEASASVPSSA